MWLIKEVLSVKKKNIQERWVDFEIKRPNIWVFTKDQIYDLTNDKEHSQKKKTNDKEVFIMLFF